MPPHTTSRYHPHNGAITTNTDPTVEQPATHLATTLTAVTNAALTAGTVTIITLCTPPTPALWRGILILGGLATTTTLAVAALILSRKQRQLRDTIGYPFSTDLTDLVNEAHQAHNLLRSLQPQNQAHARYRLWRFRRTSHRMWTSLRYSLEKAEQARHAKNTRRETRHNNKIAHYSHLLATAALTFLNSTPTTNDGDSELSTPTN